jgi:hypothetical protein
MDTDKGQIRRPSVFASYDATRDPKSDPATAGPKTESLGGLDLNFAKQHEREFLAIHFAATF